jgi:hypothetical protein
MVISTTLEITLIHKKDLLLLLLLLLPILDLRNGH